MADAASIQNATIRDAGLVNLRDGLLDLQPSGAASNGDLLLLLDDTDFSTFSNQGFSASAIAEAETRVDNLLNPFDVEVSSISSCDSSHGNTVDCSHHDPSDFEDKDDDHNLWTLKQNSFCYTLIMTERKHINLWYDHIQQRFNHYKDVGKNGNIFKVDLVNRDGQCVRATLVIHMGTGVLQIQGAGASLFVHTVYKELDQAISGAIIQQHQTSCTHSVDPVDPSQDLFTPVCGEARQKVSHRDAAAGDSGWLDTGPIHQGVYTLPPACSSLI